MQIKWFKCDRDGEWTHGEERVEPREAAVKRVGELFGTLGRGPNREGRTAVHSDTLKLLTPAELASIGAD